ncbi:MAG: O-antigen ligase family protein [Chloroflexi bacterium]|nr:O-antigen ligase family protein [Chloroflexota bacterium]
MLNRTALPRRASSSSLIPLASVSVIVALILGIANPIYAAVAVVGIVVTGLIFWRPVIGLLLLLVSVPFQSLKSVHVSAFPISSTEVLFALTMVAWLLRVVIRREQRFLAMPLLPALLLFIFGIVCSFLSIISAPPGQSSFAWGFKELVKWIELVVTYVLATNLFTTRKQLLVGASLITACAVIEAVIGAYQFVRRVGPPSFLIHGLFMRAYGTFAQPNPYGGFLNFSIILVFALAIAYWHKPVGKLLLLSGLALVGAVLISLSRSAWLALLIAFAIVFDRGGRTTRILLGLGVVLFVLIAWFYVLGILPASLSGRITAAFDVSNVNVLRPTPATFSVAQRLAFWIAGWHMFQGHWLLGVGIGNFGFAYPHYALPGWQQNLEHAHDYYLNQAVETGVLGLGTYLIWLGNALRLAWYTSGEVRDPVLRALAIGVLGMLVTLSIHNFLDDLFVHGTVVQIAIMLAWLSVVRRLEGLPTSHQPVESQPEFIQPLIAGA